MNYKGVILSKGNGKGKVLNQKQGFSGKELSECILVCSVFTPRLYLYLSICKGIIVEKGGILCHAAIVARESNIPCVQLDNATAILTNNLNVEILSDGSIIIFD